MTPLLSWDCSKPRRAAAAFVGSVLLGAATLVSGCLPDDAGGLGFGDPAPDFEAERLGGGSQSLHDYQGKTLLVNLWATWCGPCRTETPYLQSLFEDYQADGLEVVGISIDEASDRGAVTEFVREMGVTYDILLDPNRESEKTFRARGLPNSILIDADGKVVFSWLGPVEEGDESFMEGLRSALGLPAPVSRTSPATGSGSR